MGYKEGAALGGEINLHGLAGFGIENQHQAPLRDVGQTHQQRSGFIPAD